MMIDFKQFVFTVDGVRYLFTSDRPDDDRTWICQYPTDLVGRKICKIESLGCVVSSVERREHKVVFDIVTEMGSKHNELIWTCRDSLLCPNVVFGRVIDE
mgnify:CR=1 FL=1